MQAAVEEQHQVAVRSHLLNVDRLLEIQQSRRGCYHRDTCTGESNEKAPGDENGSYYFGRGDICQIMQKQMEKNVERGMGTWDYHPSGALL